MPKVKPEILINPFNLPPERAVNFFKAKGYEFSWDWFDVWQDAHSRAFTVAKTMRKDILQDIREMVQKSIDEGVTFQEFKKELEPKLKAKGWWGKVMVGDETGAQIVQLGSPHRLKTIYQTNLQTSYMAGRYKGMEEVAERRPYWQYIAVMDASTRPSHAILNGKVFRSDDPFWDTHYPPNGFRCRCRVRSLSERELNRKDLTAELSEGKLSQEEKLVSQKTGELAEVTVYRDPRTGLKMSPDVGWSYNPGKAAWKPGRVRYDQDIEKL